MSKGSHRLRYKEGPCPEFGRVRPVHLDDLLLLEERQAVHAGFVTSAMRLTWAGRTILPKPGEYLSIHQVRGKFLAAVDRLSRSCVCCADRALDFVHVTRMHDVMSQDGPCPECASDRRRDDSAGWAPPPEQNLCRKAGSSSLLAISEAIRRKSGNKP